MKSNTLFSLITLFVLFIFGFETVSACSCLAGEPCRNYSDAKVVFVGKVLDSTELTRTVKRREQPIDGEWEENEYLEKRQISRISVEESFVGTDEKKEILIETEISSSCGFPLQKDVTYLIYANQTKGEENLMTHFCSGTKPVEVAQKDLDYLRLNKDNRATISGKVGFGEWWKLDSKLLVKYGVNTVFLNNESNQFQVEINQEGLYKFTDVLPGKYKINVVLPDFLTADEEYHPDIAEELEIGDQTVIEVSDHGCLNKDFRLQENGRISGKITDAAGKPIEDITIYLILVSKTGQKIEQEEMCYDTGLCLDTDENGNYIFKGLKAGQYLVGVRIDDYVGNDSIDAAYMKTYFPDVASEKSAIPVKVKFGKQTENVNFKLTRKYQEREIKGRVFFKDGQSAAKVNVRYVARTPDLKDNGIRFIKTDENGYFSITGYENHAYLIGSFTDSRDGNENLEAIAAVVNVLPEKEIKEVKLILDQDGTADCKKCGGYSDFPKTKPRNK